jgi:DNA adenine methylase
MVRKNLPRKQNDFIESKRYLTSALAVERYHRVLIDKSLRDRKSARLCVGRGVNLLHQMNSFLKWAGSKRKLLPRLKVLIPPDYRRYVEPFAGCACLYFDLEPGNALLGDINRELIETFRQVRDYPKHVAQLLAKIECSEAEYYRIRSQAKVVLSPRERAARFIYLNRFCFNGIYRVNKRGDFNVPFGGAKGGRVPTADSLTVCARLLRSASIVASGFEQTLDRVQAGDFVYLDPPYRIEARRVFSEYSNTSFSSSDLERLRSRLKAIDRKGVPFLLSYGYSREALDLARGYRATQLMVQRQIAGFAGHRRKSRELVVTNY